MPQKIQAIRGMNDLLPSNSEVWSEIDKTISELLLSYGYKYCRPPIVESTETFSRAISGGFVSSEGFLTRKGRELLAQLNL